MTVTPEQYEFRFICPLPNGLHARPANRLEQVVSGFASRVWLENLSNSRTANARSVLSLVGADIKSGDECLLRVDGEDGAAAYQEIVRFLETEFPTCDEALPTLTREAKSVCIPPVLRAAGVPIIGGSPVVPGFGRGRVVFVQTLALPEHIAEAQDVDIERERREVDRAVAEHRSDLTLKLGAARTSATESDILRAHLSIANDVELLEKIHTILRKERVCAGRAILMAFEYFSNILRNAQSELIRERIADLQDVCSHLLHKIYGSAADSQIVLTEPSVCVADNLTPSQFIAMDKRLLSALILTHSGSTSHTVILARSFGIPTLTEVQDANRLLEAGRHVIVDANYGLLLAEITPQVERFYTSQQRVEDLRQQRLAAFRDQPARTRDGKTLEVMANVAFAEEAATAIDSGAEGIGLFRTEMLFLGRRSAPSEEEQFAAYRLAVESAGGKPVIIRTFDIGGDKPVDYLHVAEEKNPFLGLRGARLYRRHEDLLRGQLRAILRASVFGAVKILIPMVSNVEEVIHVRGVLDSVRAELDADGIAYDINIPLGIMVEVPSIAFQIPQLAGRVDFLSIGTNDLTQYFLAVDRGNLSVSSLCQSRHPGLLNLIKKIVDDAHRHGLWVGLCGELASQQETIPLLLGTGMDEVSVSAPYVLAIKAACGEYDSRQCRRLLEEAVEADTAGGVDAMIAAHDSGQADNPVIVPELVDLQADCINKEEVIKTVCDRLLLNQRTGNPIALEQDFWQREAIYSTGLGHGFAIPHCKTSHIRSNSICVLRLLRPVEWNSIDEAPVDVVIAMMIRDVGNAGDQHMKIFSRLARHMMHEAFRRQLRQIPDAPGIIAYLNEKLELE